MGQTALVQKKFVNQHFVNKQAMTSSLRILGTLPNAWRVDATIADITRPPLEPRPITIPTETKTLRLDLAKAAIYNVKQCFGFVTDSTAIAKAIKSSFEF
ncbi:MAG: hypothetical protein ACP5RH_15890 [Leptodesmis sp.]|uniref:hypothetical protein n=1 Tax=Leptodesmis sp. TaxID=3100501 RepID=UPI003D144C5B